MANVELPATVRDQDTNVKAAAELSRTDGWCARSTAGASAEAVAAAD
jgi:hypothetical protein